MKDTLKNIIKAPTRLDFGVGFFLAIIIIAGLFTVIYLKKDNILDDRQARVPSVTVSVSLGRATTPTPIAQETVKTESTEKSPPQETVIADVKKTLLVPETVETETNLSKTEIGVGASTPLINKETAAPIETVETEALDTPIMQTGLRNDDMVPPAIEEIPSEDIQKNTPALDDYTPIVQLTESSSFGPIPRIASDGTIPWLAHAKETDDIAGKKYISLIISAIGQSRPVTQLALTTLPHATTLAITPYTRLDLADDSYKGLKNFETLVMLPMESKRFPIKDPGPRALISNYSKTQNTENLHWVLSRGSNYIGLMNMMGDAFLNGPEGITNLFTELRERGLTFLNTISPSQNLGDEIAKDTSTPYLNADLFIDTVPSRQEIMAQLKALEIIAQETGYAIGVAQPLPLTFDIIAEWQERLGNDVSLVPLSVIYKDNYNIIQ